MRLEAEIYKDKHVESLILNIRDPPTIIVGVLVLIKGFLSPHRQHVDALCILPENILICKFI